MGTDHTPLLMTFICNTCGSSEFTLVSHALLSNKSKGAGSMSGLATVNELLKIDQCISNTHQLLVKSSPSEEGLPKCLHVDELQGRIRESSQLY